MMPSSLGIGCGQHRRRDGINVPVGLGVVARGVVCSKKRLGHGEEGRWVEVGDDCGSFVSGGKICWLLARGDPLTRMFPVFLWCFLGADSS